MTEWYLLLPLMILCHIIEDFHIQGVMGDMKQASFWNPYGEKYADDWKPVIILHGMEWAMLTSMPCLVMSWFDVPMWFVLVIVAMGLLHAYIDHLKANEGKINLITDQTLHMSQIMIIYLAYLGV